MLAPVSRFPPRLVLIVSLVAAVVVAWAPRPAPAQSPPRLAPGEATAVVPATTAAMGPTVEMAGQRLAEGRATEAWDLLSPLEGRLAGDPEFDYLLALAALGSGRPAAALAPLRRVLALEPRFDGARLELARALAASGDAGGARREYEAIA
jgi:predicted Zn-dependent protease